MLDPTWQVARNPLSQYVCREGPAKHILFNVLIQLIMLNNDKHATKSKKDSKKKDRKIKLMKALLENTKIDKERERELSVSSFHQTGRRKGGNCHVKKLFSVKQKVNLCKEICILTACCKNLQKCKLVTLSAVSCQLSCKLYSCLRCTQIIFCLHYVHLKNENLLL
jgi:hypothetical protein